jgi:HAD superfamily hydrolase (TIGR01509 family)
VRLRLVFVALVALFAAACQADARIDVVVEGDGSGTVVFTLDLDAQIVEEAPEILENLRTEDLAAADWTLEGPTATESGGATMTATKAFASRELLAGVLDEIAGSGELFSDVLVERERSFARTTYTISGEIDQTFNIESLGDEGVVGWLGLPLGRPVSELEAIAGEPISNTLELRFSVTLPDTIEANTPTVDGRTATWVITPNDQLPTEFVASSSVEDQEPRIWAAMALVALAVLATLLAFRLLAKLGRRARRGDEVDGDAVQLRRPERSMRDPGAAPETEERPPRLELIVLDARGVLYDEANDIGARLVPFVRERGSKASLQEINDAFRAASLGRLSAAELWSNLSVEGEPAELDELYTREFVLRDGVLEFIDRLHERDLRVAVITNNIAGWSKQIRDKFNLDERVDTWVVSGEIGTRKPDAAFFEAVRRMTGVSFADSLLIDDQIDDLDMARSLGMSTAMFVPPASQLPAQSPHPIVHGFDSFFGRREASS